MSSKYALEAAILGCMMINNDTIPAVRHTVPLKWMWTCREHCDIFVAICNAYDSRSPARAKVDAVVVWDHMRADKHCRTRVEYLARVLEACPHTDVNILLERLMRAGIGG